MNERGVPYVDADGHVLEPPSLWDEYLEPKQRGRFELRSEAIGEIAYVDGEQVCKMPAPAALAGAVGVPGEEVFSGRFRYRDARAGGFDGKARLADLDADRIDMAVLYPSIWLCLQGVRDPKLAAAMMRAYNDWMQEYCGADRARLHPVGVVALQNMEASLRELERLAGDMGVATVMVRTNTPRERPFHGAHYEPFWAACERLGVLVALHPFAIDDMYGVTTCFDLGTIFHVAAIGFPLDMILTLSQLIGGGVLERHPALRVLILESSVGWLPTMLARMDHQYEVIGNLVPYLPHPPSFYWERQCSISFEPDEEQVPALLPWIGARKLVWATDYPHFDATFPGVTDELDKAIGGLPPEDQDRIVGLNAVELYSLRI